MYSYRKNIKNPSYFKKDELFIDYVTHFNKKFDLYLVKCEFEAELINFIDFIKTEYFFNTSIVNMKKYLIYYIFQTFSRGRKLSHTPKKKIKLLVI